jgi:hypothetical protein
MAQSPNADPAFLALLEHFSIDRLEADETPIFGLWSNLRVAYANPAGEQLVRAASPGLARWGVGSSILPALPERLRFFYVEELQRVVANGKIVRHVEDPVVSGLPPRRAELLPLWGSGVLVTFVPVIDASASPGAPLDARYRSDNGFILECSYCHCFRRAGAVERWEWVPSFVTRTPERTTHGVCYRCFGYHAH